MFSEISAQSIRFLWSYLYRLFLITLVVIIVNDSNKASIAFSILLPCIGLWMFGFHFIRLRYGSIARLLYDYLPIFIAIYFRNDWCIECVFLVLLPIINHSNHTSNYKSISSTFLFCLLWSVSYYFAIENLTTLVVVFFIFVIVVVWFDFFVCKIRRFGIDLEKTTYSLIDSEIRMEALHVLLDRLKSKTNKQLKLFRINEMFMFENVNNVLTVRVSTRFYSNIKAINKSGKYSEAPSLANANVVLTNCELSPSEKCLSLDILSSKKEYSFVFIVSSPWYTFGLESFLIPIIFTKAIKNVLRIYKIRRNVDMQTRNSSRIMIEKAQYIDSVRATAHFIRNNLTAFKSVNDMLTAYLENELLDGEPIVLKEDLVRPNNLYKMKLEKIEEYIDLLLKAPKNDMLYEESKRVSSAYIIKLANETLEHYGLELAFVKEMSADFNHNEKKYMIWPNNLLILFDNLVTNMVKHGEQCKVELVFDAEMVVMKFANKLKKSKIANLETYVKRLNMDTNGSILQREGEGLWIIRRTIQNMNAKIFTNLDVVDKSFRFEISIGKHND